MLLKRSRTNNALIRMRVRIGEARILVTRRIDDADAANSGPIDLVMSAVGAVVLASCCASSLGTARSGTATNKTANAKSKQQQAQNTMLI